MHGVDNIYQQIFGGLQLTNTTDYIKSARVWITNWDDTTDSLSMTASTDRRGYNFASYNYILTNITSDGTLHLNMAHQKWTDNNQVSPIGELHWPDEDGQDLYWLPHWAWNDILRMPSYRYFPTEESMKRCEDYIGTYKEFAIQLIDRRDRISQIYYHRMYLRGAGMIYTDATKVITTNEIDGEILMSPNRTLLSSVDEFFLH